MMKKLSEEHYIVVDDLDIKIGDIVAEKLLTGKYELFTIQTLNDIDRQTQKKIIYSTQPESLGVGWMQSVQPLLLSEVEELLGIVDVEKKSYAFKKEIGGTRQERLAYIDGYSEALEDNKEKKYTEKDMQWALHEARYHQQHTIEEIIEALHQPKTEWEMEIVEGKLKLKL